MAELELTPADEAFFNELFGDFQEATSGIDLSPVSSPHQTVPTSSPEMSPPDSPGDAAIPFETPFSVDTQNLLFGSLVHNNPFAPIHIKEDPYKLKYEDFEGSSSGDEDWSVCGRKRSREEMEKSDSLDELSREDLLKLTSQSLEDIAKTISSSRPLTVDEERKLKRQRRLIKNRESAQLSRQRKKRYIEELEKEVTHLRQEADTLRSHASALNLENNQLRQEVWKLQAALQQQQQNTDPSQPTSSTPAADLPSTLWLNKQTHQHANKQRVLVGGVVTMFIVLFSFGLFFNGQMAPFPGHKFIREPIPEVVPKSVQYTGRTLHGMEEDEAEAEELHSSETIANQPSPFTTEPKVEVANKQKPRVIIQDHFDAWEDVKLETDDVYDKNSQPTIRIIKTTPYGSNSVEDISRGVALRDSLASANPMKEQTDATAYFYCPTAQEIIPASSVITEKSNVPTSLSLLVPSAALNSSLPAELSDKIDLERTLVEINCQITNINIYPSFLSAPMDESHDHAVVEAF